MSDDDDDIDIRFQDDPTEPIEEGAARFELMYPDPAKYPSANKIMVRITFEDMSVIATFPSSRARRFQDLIRTFDRAVPKLIEARDREAEVRREASGLDSELASLFDEEVEE